MDNYPVQSQFHFINAKGNYLYQSKANVNASESASCVTRRSTAKLQREFRVILTPNQILPP